MSPDRFLIFIQLPPTITSSDNAAGRKREEKRHSSGAQGWVTTINDLYLSHAQAYLQPLPLFSSYLGMERHQPKPANTSPEQQLRSISSYHIHAGTID